MKNMQSPVLQVDSPHEYGCMKFYFAFICVFLSCYSKDFPLCIYTVIVSKWIWISLGQLWQTLKIWNKSCISTSIMHSTRDITLISQLFGFL